MSSACSTRPRPPATSMPAATPVPRGPTVLTLYTAADLLTGPGCPVCRYAGEAADRYLAWFALEGHADVVTITRLCSSLGMCPRHTRGLMSQPGAATRLTAVYQYVIRAARDRLSGRAARLGACPGCGHDDGAAGRALDTLLEGLADDPVRDRYRELGGLCVPHLRMASARGTRRTLAWLSQTMTAAAGSDPACPGWLAGTDHDADVRAVLRQAARADESPPSQVCMACLAAVRSEDDRLAHILRASDRGLPDGRGLLCGSHLGDAVALAGRRGAPSVLAWQAGCLTAGLARHRAPAGSPAGWLAADPARPRRAGRLPGMPDQRGRGPAGRRRPSRLAARPASGSRPPGVPVRPAPAGPERTGSVGRSHRSAWRGGARGQADRRTGPGVQQEHLGTPPRSQGAGNDRVAASSRLPRRPGVLRVPAARNVTLARLDAAVSFPACHSEGRACWRRSPAAGCTWPRVPRVRGRRSSGGRSRYPRPGRR